MGTGCTKLSKRQRREEDQLSVPYVSAGRANEDKPSHSLPTEKSSQATTTTLTNYSQDVPISYRTSTTATETESDDIYRTPAKKRIPREKRSPLRKFFGIFKKKRKRETEDDYYYGEEERFDEGDETQDTIDISDLAETSVVYEDELSTADRPGDIDQTSDVYEDKLSADQPPHFEHSPRTDSVLSLTPQNSPRGDEIILRKTEVPIEMPIHPQVDFAVSYQQAVVTTGDLAIVTSRTRLFQSTCGGPLSLALLPQATLVITSTTVASTTFVTSSMPGSPLLSPPKQYLEQHALVPYSMQQALLPCPSQKPPGGRKEESRRHFLNVELTYDGRSLTTAEKEWLEKQIAGLVNVILERGKVPENLSIANMMKNPRESARTPLKICTNYTTPNSDGEVINLQSKRPGSRLKLGGDTVMAEADDEELDLAYDPIGLKETIVMRRSLRDAKIKYKDVVTELGRKLSGESINDSYLLTSVSSMNSSTTFITAQEDPVDKEMQHFDESRKQSDTDATVVASPTPDDVSESRYICVKISEMDIGSVDTQDGIDFSSRSEPVIRSEATNSVEKAVMETSTPINSPTKKHHMITESASSPPFFRVDKDHAVSQSSILDESNHDRIIHSLIEESTGLVTNSVKDTDTELPGRDERNQQHLTGTYSSSSSSNTIVPMMPMESTQKDCECDVDTGPVSPAASAKQIYSPRTAFQKVGRNSPQALFTSTAPISTQVSNFSAVTKPIALRADESHKVKIPLSSPRSVEITSYTDLTLKAVEGQKSAPGPQTARPKSNAAPSPRLVKSSIARTRVNEATKLQNVVSSLEKISPRPSTVSTGDGSLGFPKVAMPAKEKSSQNKKHTPAQQDMFAPGDANLKTVSSVVLLNKKTSGSKQGRRSGITDVPGHFKPEKAAGKFIADHAQNVVPLMRTPKYKKHRCASGKNEEGKSEEKLGKKQVHKSRKSRDNSFAARSHIQSSRSKPPTPQSVLSISTNPSSCSRSPPVINENFSDSGANASRSEESQVTIQSDVTLSDKEFDRRNCGASPELRPGTPRHRRHHVKKPNRDRSQTPPELDRRRPQHSSRVSPQHHPETSPRRHAWHSTEGSASQPSIRASKKSSRVTFDDTPPTSSRRKKGEALQAPPSSDKAQFQPPTPQFGAGSQGVCFSPFQISGPIPGGNAVSPMQGMPHVMYMTPSQPHPLLNIVHPGQNQSIRQPTPDASTRNGGGPAQYWNQMPSGLQPPYGSPFLSPTRINIPGCQFPTMAGAMSGHPHFFPYPPQPGPYSPYSGFPQYAMAHAQSQGNGAGEEVSPSNKTHASAQTAASASKLSVTSTPTKAVQYPSNANLVGQNAESTPNDRRGTKESEPKSENSESKTSFKSPSASASSSTTKSRRWRQCEREKDEGEAWWMPKDWAKERGIGTYGKKWQFEKEKREKKEKELEIAKDANIEQIRMSRFIPW